MFYFLDIIDVNCLKIKGGGISTAIQSLNQLIDVYIFGNSVR